MSVLIGVNDVWHELGHNNGCSHAQYERNYCMFLEEVMAALPNIKIVILEPFLTGGSVHEKFGEEFLTAVKKNAAIAKKIAEKYGLPFVALQEKFDDWEKQFGAEALTREGVHPTIMGHSLIAKALLDTLDSVITD
jgi:lysophospholipase L1-like esterase